MISFCKFVTIHPAKVEIRGRNCLANNVITTLFS